ncbi:Ppx/GppA family phosphatase [Tepidamorphus sp. 3E244]|uniref:Ppx/GppA family phosphatase n=1 Tax=Tepidamorphus sp. 3E244 TaxID=3385498 RepID=UPI0038FBF3B3
MSNGSPGRLPWNKPIAVVDIGSNSVRLVVYEGLTRCPTPIFNEKALCGLGTNLASTGRLNEDGVKLALTALRRFRALCDQMRVDSLNVIATAAAREAENGSGFVREAETICRAPVRILTGEDEALLAAYGVVSGLYEPDGLVGDLGGGSLELVDVHGDQVGDGATLPLGVLRLRDVTGEKPDKAEEMVAKSIAVCPVAPSGKDRPFYAIGGSFRSIAKLHMASKQYPLLVMHNYEIEIDEARDFIKEVKRGKLDSMQKQAGISDARFNLMPYGAAVMEGVLDVISPSKLVMSALGVREGLLYSLLPQSEREIDPLIASAEELAYLRSRSPAHASELVRWTDGLFASLDLDENESERRIRHAATLLTDIGWRAHPDYRGEQSVNVIANAAFIGVDHEGRIFMALTVSHRHNGVNNPGLPDRLLALVRPKLQERARILGGAMRVAYLITASMAGVLDETPLAKEADKLVLRLPASRADLAGNRLETRLKQLSKVLSLDPEIVIES